MKSLQSFLLFALVSTLLLSAHTVTAQGDDPPDQPVLMGPADQSTENPTGVTLSIMVNDPDPEPLTVTFFGRKKPGPDDEFTIIDLPDTQYYTGELYGGSKEIFYSQTQWIVDHRADNNIVYVIQPGDCVENGNLVEEEWKRADTAMKIIEDPITTTLTEGIPYVIAVGNHDQTPGGWPNGNTTTLFNTYFGVSRFAEREYYGGHYGDNNDNSYQFFSGGGMDFIVITIEYDVNADPMVLNWADSLLDMHINRRAIIVSHYILQPGNPGNFSPQGQAIYNQFKDNPNVFLMLGAHYSGEGQRTDSFEGDTIHTLLADYQSRENGGNGWLRILHFSPASNTIMVKTYSPWLDQWEQDTDSEFELIYNMNDAGLDTLDRFENAVPGSTVEIEWSNLDPNNTYEWFAVVDDGIEKVISPRWTFTTGDHKLDVKVLLQGPFYEGNMENGLGDSIPLDQPYSQDPWNYPGTESVVTIPPDVVDWVLVELRDASEALSADSSKRLLRMAAFLKTNGDIVSIDGTSVLTFPNQINQNLLAVIWHRNHLPVMAANPLVNSSGIFAYDFTLDETTIFGGSEGAVLLPGNLWGMVAGDSNADGQIDVDDKSSWNGSTGYAGYLLNDLNLDRQANNQDKNEIWWQNIGKSAQLPE